jgi:hypothetical protein
MRMIGFMGKVAKYSPSHDTMGANSKQISKLSVSNKTRSVSKTTLSERTFVADTAEEDVVEEVNPLPTVVPAQGQQETMFFRTL